MKQKLCAILILIMLLLNSSLMTVISVAIEAVNNAADLTNEEVGEDTKVSNVDLKLNADYLVNNVENKVELTATLKTDDTKYSLFKNPTISIEMPSEIVDVVIGTPYLMYNNQIFTITKSEVVTNEVGNKVINVQLEGEQTEYETDSILEGTNIVIPASIVVSKQIDTMVSNIKLRYTNEIKCQTIYEANGEECEKQEINLINKIVRNLPAIASDEEAKTIEFEQDGIKVEIIEKVGNTVIPDNGTLYEQQIVKNVVKFTNNSTTVKPVSFTANIPDGLTYTEFIPQEIVHNEEYDAYYIPNHPSYKTDETKKQLNVNIEELGVGETKETYFELQVNNLEGVSEKVTSIDYILINSNGEVNTYTISNTIIEAEIKATLQCYRLNDRNDWQYALTFTNITDRILTNINVHCDIDKNFDINKIYKVESSGKHVYYDINNVQDNTFVYSIESLEPNKKYYIAVDGVTKDIYEDETNTYEMKGVYKIYGDEINTYVSNETSVIAGIEKVKVSMTSNKDGQELKMNDEIIYTINIENIGNEKLAMRKFSKIRIFDFIPEELEPISATYNNFITNTQYTENAGDYLGAPIEIDTYTEEQKSLDLTYKIVKEGATEQETPNFDLDLSIPYGKIITIVIKAKVKMITEKAEIANTVTVEGNGMITKTASVANIVLPYNYDQIQNPVNPEKPDTEGTTGGIIDDTEESTNPEDPSEIKVTDVEITPTKTTLKVGQSLDLIATIKPDNATNKGINWSTSDENIAVVMNGTVIAIKEGTAIITVTTQDGSKTATCEVTVSGNSSIPTDPEKPDESEKPVNPNMPEKPDNPNIQEKPEDENINISGMAWIDENQNGKRDEEESPYSNMTVMLYNYQTKKLVSIDGIAIEKKTDQNGKYKFTDLQAGKYIAIFWYDTTNYELTEYQKVGISSIENSDAVSKNVTLQGEKRLAGLTDIIILEQNTENIDIGLVEKKESDFSIQKYISKITIKTNKETKTYTYDNKNFAKVEVHSKQINGAQAIIEYKMVVKNEGELPGRVDLIVDEIPNDLKFYSELNSSWYKSKAGIATTALSREIIGVGESREVTIVLTKNLNGNNIGTVSNTAKIVQTSNEKAIEEQNIENNTAKAEILITVSTGMIKWIGLVIGVLIVLGFIVFIAIQDKKIMKTISFVFIFGVFIFGNIMQVYAEGLRDDGFSDTGWTYTVDGVTDLHCTTPDNTMCPTSEYHWIISTTKGEQRGSAWLDREEKPDNIEFTLQNATINENVKMVLNGDKIKLGPFRINVLRGTEIATDVKIKSCNVTYYTKVNDDGSIPYETLSVNVPVGQDFYINLPKDTIQVVKIDINADYSYNSREYYKTYYRYYYEIGAKGVNEKHKSYTGEIVSCVTQYLAGNAQILGKDIEEEYYKDITKTFTRELTINGPWTPPGSLTIEKIAFDREEVEIDGQKVKVEKTYIPNVEIKVMKGTDENASRYFQLFNTAGNRISEINVSGTIQFPNPSLYTAGSNEDSDISVLVNGKQYTAKWTGSKDRATKLVLLDGKVTMSNLKCGVGAYTVIETKNPNYGYDPEDNTNLKGSIQAITPFDTNEITIVNGKSTGGLVIRKVDYSDNTPLANVEFLVEAKIDDDEKGYLKIIVDDSPNVTKFKNSDYAKVVKGYCKIKDMIPTDTAPISYVSNPEEATKFITNEEGIVTIANLPATPVVDDSKPKVGKTKWYYRAQEIWNPNYGYSKEKYYEFGRTKYRADDTSAWAVDTSTGWKLLPTIWLYDTNHPEYKSYGTPYRITVTNQKLIGNIYVTKKDAESEEDINLGHIGFVLKAKLTETTENSNSSMFNMNNKYIKVKINEGSYENGNDGYAKYAEGNIRIADGEFTGSTTDVIQYVDDPNEATVFYTDINGQLLIANLLKSTNGNNYIEYRFEEYDSKTYGYVAEIGEGYTNATVEFTDYEKNDSFGERPETSPYIPVGFSKVNGTDLNTGLVIEDEDGNQFVWIEVPRTSEVYKKAGLRITQFTDEEYKKIETDLQAYTSVYRNGTLATDEHDGNVSATGLEQYEYYTQKRKMLKSIYNYGGFYIGRYETGIEDKSRTQESESPVETPVIKANAYPYTWLRCSQAQDIARNMYFGDYTSSLMFGVQWDLVLKYLETKGMIQTELNEDSTEWGNYTNNEYTITNTYSKYREPSSSWKKGAYGKKQAGLSLFLSTGANTKFSKQNIFDLAGNVREWTLEKSNESNYPCVYRGGSFDVGGSVATASERLNLNSEFKNGNVGFRVALYTNEDPNYTYDRTLENEIDRVTKDGWVTPKIEFTSKNPTKEQCTKVEILNYKQTGNLIITKVDSRDNNEKLPNVEFVLKAQREQGSSNKNYRYKNIDGKYVKAELETLKNGGKRITNIEYVSDIKEATVFKTNSDGKCTIYNLLMSINGINKIMYKLIETKNPNYGYLADTENFSDFKVTFESDRLNGEYIVPKRQTSLETLGKTSGNDTKLTVKNEQIYTRLSGIVWEDISLGKDNNIDNIYKEDSNDALINGITVYLYKDGEQVATTTTNENGYYEFGTKHKENGIYENLDYWKNNNNIPQRDGNNLISKAVNENGNLVINDLNKYSIEFEYDGLRFTTVAQGEDSISSRGKEIAKATEIIKDRNRESVDASFTTVYGGTSADENGVIKGQTNKYDLKYNANTPKNNQSQYIEHWGYSDYGTNNNGKKYFTLTQPENGEDYIIRASVKGSYITWKQEYASIDMIPYINQGIYRKEQPDLAIESDIEKVEVTVDKYTNTYIYSGRNLDNENIGEETHGFDVEVKYGNKTETSYSSRGLDTYTRPLYASDLAYNLTDPDNELMQVYVTYQIVVKNQSNTLTTKVNEIVNYFDSRYDIENVNGATYDANSIEDVSDENQTVKYKKVKLKLDETIKHGQKGSVITITFKLNKDALIVIAHERAMLYNVSEIASYSTFYGDETLCAENKTANENQVVNKIYSGIDTDSAPGSANIVAEVENENNITKIKVNGDGIEYDYSTPNVKLSDSSKATFEDDTGLAPSLVLGIDEKDPTRGLNGIVFEDNAVFEDCDNEEHRQTGIHVGETRVGNGIYEKGENLVKDTKVELYNVNKTQGDVQEGNATTKAKLYKLIIEGNMAHVEIEDAVTWSKDDISDNSGKTYNYELMGIIPDEYLIRYSYGNIEETAEDGTATSRITQIVKNGGKLKEVAAMDYKSTILKSDIIIQALDIFNIPDRIKDLNWILAEEKNGDDIIRYSDAADDLNLRNDQEDIYYGKHYELNTMSADTAVFEVGVEFTENIDKINNSGEIIGRETKTKELVLEDTNGDGKFGIGDKVVRVPEYSIVNSYQDFGIIERAIPDQYIEKTVSNIKIVLQNGQELINGNPYEDELSYVKALKMGNNPRKEAQKSIFVEIDNEILQGSTLYLKYDIKAYNNSELDYKYNKKDTNNPNSPDVPNTPGNRFYYLGEKGEGVEVQNSILKVVDYMDNELVLDTETMTKEGKWKTIDIDYLIGKGENSEGKIFISDKVKTLLENNKYTILVTDAFKELQPGQQATIQTYASKLLSVGEGDLKFVNHAEIIHTTGTRKVNNSTPGNYEPVQQNPNEQDDDNVKVVITPPTGLPLSKINQ